MALTAPPSRWQSDDTGGAWNQGNQSRGAGTFIMLFKQGITCNQTGSESYFFLKHNTRSWC